MISGDFNARSSLWDQQGTNKHECALEEAFSDVLFTAVSTATPTRLGARQSNIDSTNDLELVPPWLAPWTRDKTFASNGSGLLPRLKPQYPSEYRKSDTGVMFKLRTLKPISQQIRNRKPSANHPGGAKETQSAGTDKW